MTTPPPPSPSTEIAARQPAPLDSWVDVIRPITILAGQIADTDFVPKALRGNAPAIAAAILHGRELGMSPMTALAQTHVIEGRPSTSAEGQRGLVLAAGHEIEYTELSDAVATVRGRRAGQERWTSVTWTLDRARSAGLAGRNQWRTYPRAMLAARASAELCRLLFPDVTHGLAAFEELDEPEVAQNGAQRGSTRPVARGALPEAPPLPQSNPEPPRAPRGRAIEDVPLPEPPEPEEPVDKAPTERVTPSQLRMLGAVWNKYRASDDERRALSAMLVGRDLEGSTRNLTKIEASMILDRLTGILAELGEGADPDAARLAFDVTVGGAYFHEEATADE
jgi:hypothetical protein